MGLPMRQPMRLLMRLLIKLVDDRVVPFFSMQPVKLVQLRAAAHDDDGRVIEYGSKPR